MTDSELAKITNDRLRDDASGLGTLKATIQNELSVEQRIGMGLRALYNQPLLERLPEAFRRVLRRMEDRNR